MSEGFKQIDHWISFDIDIHIVDALELVVEKLQQVHERPTAWKWVVIGLHSAMHGGFAQVLRRTDGAQLLPKKQEQQVYASWDRERETGVIESLHPDHVDWFLQLYAKTKDPERMSYLGGIPLDESKAPNQWVEKLNDFRGGLMHFSATSWSIETELLLDMLDELLPLLRFYYFEAQRNQFIDQDLSERSKNLLDEIQSQSALIRGELDRFSDTSHSIPDELDKLIDEVLKVQN